MLRRCRGWFPGKELGGATLAARGAPASVKAAAKPTTNAVFTFFFFFVKAKVLRVSFSWGKQVLM